MGHEHDCCFSKYHVTRISSLRSSLFTCLQNSLMLAKEARSHFLTLHWWYQVPVPWPDLTSPHIDALPSNVPGCRLSSLQVPAGQDHLLTLVIPPPIIRCHLTLAPLSARPRAVSLPIPVLAPVTMVTHPVRSTWSWSAHYHHSTKLNMTPSDSS